MTPLSVTDRVASSCIPAPLLEHPSNKRTAASRHCIVQLMCQVRQQTIGAGWLNYFKTKQLCKYTRPFQEEIGGH